MSYFALVRYIPDIERNEPVNVGILLATPNTFRTRFLYREEVRDWSIVERFCGLLEQELNEAVEPASELRELASRRFPDFEITEPRQIVSPDDVDVAVNDLAHRLVEATTTLPTR